MRNLYLDNRFFFAFAAVIVLFILGYQFYFVFVLAKLALIALFCFVGLDIFWLYFSGASVEAKRSLPKLFSLSDENKVSLNIANKVVGHST